MKRTIVILTLATAFCALPERISAQPAQAPEPTVTHELRLRDGSRVYGRVASVSDSQIVFETAAGATLTAEHSQIVLLRKVNGEMRDGEFQPADPNNTRLFFGPTGRSLPKGQTYLGVYEFAMPFLQVGVTDRFSIGGGTPLLFGFGEGFDRPFWVTPKFQVFNGAKAQVSVGVFQGFGGGDSAGIAYGVATAGGHRGSLTAGVGMAYNSDGDRTAVVMVGGDRPIRKNLKFVTENYVWASGDGVVSGGIRFFGDKLSADLALATPIGIEEGFFVFPVFNFVYLF